MPRSTDGSSDDDPRSPTAAVAAAVPHHSSSDESSSSDVVLVDLPSQDAQEPSRDPDPDPDSGILVNIDGSEAREETFEDASDHLGTARAAAAAAAELDFTDRTDHELDRIKLDDSLAQCRKYKEERELFGREIADLRRQLQSATDGSPLGEEDPASSPTPLHSMISDCSRLVSQFLDGKMKSVLSTKEQEIAELNAVLHAKDEEILELNAKVLESEVSNDVVVSCLGAVWEESVVERVNKLAEERSEMSEQLGVMRRSLEAANAEAERARAEAEQTESKLVGTREKLSMAVTKGKSLVQHRDTLKQSLAERTAEVESCREELQRTTDALLSSKAAAEGLESELQSCRQELQHTSEDLLSTKAAAEGLESELQSCRLELQRTNENLLSTKAAAEGLEIELQSCRQELQQTSEDLLSTKARAEGLESELENRLLELQEKSDAVVSMEASAEELQRSLAEKNSKLEQCLLELDEKTNALNVTKINSEELQKSLDDKTSEVERYLLELKKISSDLGSAKEHSDRSIEAQSLAQSLQELVSHRDMVIQEMEETVSRYDSSPELLSMGVVDRVKWLIEQKQVTDAFVLDNRKIKDALSTIDLPEDVSSADLESQIRWLGESLAQAKTDFTKLQDEITSAHVRVALHETELSETHMEIDRLTASLLEERLVKDSLQDKVNDLTSKYEEMDQKLSKISSEKDELMKVLIEVSGSTFDEQTSVDTDMMVEKCIGKIKEMTTAHLSEKEEFDRIQSLLYVKDQELVLLQSMFDEVTFDRSELESISAKLGSALEEIATLRNERNFLQTELERVEERSSQIRDRLSLAVRKGKGLVQERDGYKHSLEEKSTQIDMLKQELQNRDSAIATYMEQINSISAYTEQIQKLELDVISLKDQRDETVRNLQERNTTMQNLLVALESVVPPTNKHFEEPIEKVTWISEHIHKLELAKLDIEQELEKVKEESTLQSSKLAEAFTTIKLLEDEMSKADKEISSITEEKNIMQLRMTSLEQELETMKEDHHMQASKLADAYTTIKTLEQSLSNADTQILYLSSERTEIETRNKSEISSLNAKLADCMEELARTHGSLESKSDELTTQIGDLQVLVKDGSLLSLMTEEFRKKVEDLSIMDSLILNMQEQLAAKGLQISGSEQHPRSLTDFGDFIKERIVRLEIGTGDPGVVSSFTKLSEGFRFRATLLGDTFKELSSYLDGHIALTVQALQATRDQFVHILEVNESLTTNLKTFEAQNKAQEFKIVSLQKENMTLLSACTGATEELQIEHHGLMGLDSSSELEKINFDLESTSKEAVFGAKEELDTHESPKIAKSLLLTARRIRYQLEELANVRRAWITSTSDLESKLKQTELTAANAVRDAHLNEERVSKLQVDLDELQLICREMKAKIEGYQAREDTVRDKEAELLSLEHNLTSQHRGLGDSLLSQDQMESLIDKINGMEVPSNLSETQREILFSSPFEKLFYILDKVTELQHTLDSLSYEKEITRLSLESHGREIEHLKKVAETTGVDNQELEVKKTELNDLTSGLERIIQRLAGNYSFEDQKPVTAKRLLPILDRLTSASNTEAEKLKSRMQELAVELLEKENVANELSEKVKFLEGSIHGSVAQPDSVKDRSVFDSSTSAAGSEISEIEDLGPLVKSSKSPVSAAAHVRSMRKGSSDHLVLNIESESERLISAGETDDKGHFFKSLNASGLIPKQGKMVADRVDGIWVSGGRLLRSRPGARLGLIGYWLFLHLWLLGTVL